MFENETNRVIRMITGLDMNQFCCIMRRSESFTDLQTKTSVTTICSATTVSSISNKKLGLKITCCT